MNATTVDPIDEVASPAPEQGATYNLGFSEYLIRAAQPFVEDGSITDDINAVRTVLYLSSLASEIAIKSLLEKAGKSIGSIRRRGHNLGRLLADLDECEVQIEPVQNHLMWTPARRIGVKTVDSNYSNATVKMILTGSEDMSEYPAQLRYGDSLRDYLPTLKLKAAQALVAEAHQYWDVIRVP